MSSFTKRFAPTSVFQPTTSGMAPRCSRILFAMTDSSSSALSIPWRRASSNSSTVCQTFPAPPIIPPLDPHPERADPGVPARRKTSRLASMIGWSLVSACATPPSLGTVTVPLEAPFELQAGRQATVRGTPFQFRFAGVLEDSRCPADVVCVWQGDGHVRITVLQPDSSARDLDLHTSLEPRSARLGDYSIVLEALQPAPRSTTSIAPTDYVATLRVTRGRD